MDRKPARGRFTRSEGGYLLAVELSESKELVGMFAAFTRTVPITRRIYADNYSFPPTPGLGVEAARAIIDFLFDGLCVRRVSVSCPGQDTAARRTLEKAACGKRANSYKIPGYDGDGWVNLSWYAMLKEERPLALSY